MTIFNYTVNYVDVGIVAVVLLAAIIGWHRGIIMSVVNFIRYSIGLFLCFYFSSNVSPIVYEQYVREQCLKVINERIVTSGNIDEIIKNLNKFGESVPKALSQFMDFKSIDISSGDIAQSILTSVFEPIALALTKTAVFIAVFLLFFLATGMIIAVARKSSKKKEERRGRKSALKTTDKTFGLLFGLLKAAVIILAFTSIMMYILNLEDNMADKNVFLAEAANSSLLKYIDDINPFNAITEGFV